MKTLRATPMLVLLLGLCCRNIRFGDGWNVANFSTRVQRRLCPYPAPTDPRAQDCSTQDRSRTVAGQRPFSAICPHPVYSPPLTEPKSMRFFLLSIPKRSARSRITESRPGKPSTSLRHKFCAKLSCLSSVLDLTLDICKAFWTSVKLE